MARSNKAITSVLTEGTNKPNIETTNKAVSELARTDNHVTRRHWDMPRVHELIVRLSKKSVVITDLTY